MSHAIRHRGPDLDRAYGNGRAHFAFRRLSIIDLRAARSPSSAKTAAISPSTTARSTTTSELRDELISRGTVFRTRSEIETIVALYAAGASFINRLRGMFAFLLYDSETGVLMAGRDPFGIKPLYYRETADGYVFASEMKAYLFDSGYDGFKVDPALLQHYLTFQYVTEPDTLAGDIRILPKGSYMLCDGEHTEINAYHVRCSRRRRAPTPKKKLRLREAVENSVASHMLSGRAAGQLPFQRRRLGGYHGGRLQAVAGHQGVHRRLRRAWLLRAGGRRRHLRASRHRPRQAGMHAAGLHRQLRKVIYHLDSPVGDPSVVAIYLISQEAARHVKVILSGEGATSCSAATASTPPRRPATGWGGCRSASKRRWPRSRARCRRRSRAAASCCAG